MANLLKNLNISVKIMGSFLLGIVFILIVGIFSITKLYGINNVVHLMAGHLAADQKLAADVSTLILKTRLEALHYLADGDENDLTVYNQVHSDLNDAMQRLITDDEDRSTDMATFDALQAGITDYDKTFQRIVALMRMQNETISNVLDGQSPKMEEGIGQLRTAMAENGQTDELNTVGDIIVHWLMFTRSTTRYIDTEETHYFDDAQQHFNQMNDAFNTMQALITNDEQMATVGKAQAAAKAYFQGVQDLHNVIEEKKGLITRLNDDGPQLLASAESIAADKQAAFDTEAERAQITTTQSVQFMIVLMTLLVLLAGVLGWSTTQGIVKSIGYLAKALKRMAGGAVDIDVSKLSVQKNEFGDLSRILEELVNTTRETADVAQRISNGDLTVSFSPRSEDDILGHALQTMLENLRIQNSELMDGVAILSSSASQLISTSTELAASASETASAITETTATIAELRQTADLTAERANLVADKARQNSEIAQNGLHAMEQTLSEMEEIDAHIETIADSIIHLSEQGQTISSIISAVEDLAEQSNLLAVNAAIEAAKAGEQGKGFAVVAQEIKSLAEQSKQFTVQVQAILNDLQKATSKAVMTTEEGSKRVAKGKQQSVETGNAIRQLTQHVNEAVQSAMQISSSSREQLIGVKQVSTAMENIKEASEQNVDGARQLEMSAQELERLATRIQEIFTK